MQIYYASENLESYITKTVLLDTSVWTKYSKRMCNVSIYALLVSPLYSTLVTTDLPVLYPVHCTALWNEASHHQSFLQ